jgi:hypothetical protein
MWMTREVWRAIANAMKMINFITVKVIQLPSPVHGTLRAKPSDWYDYPTLINPLYLGQ